MTDRGDRSAGDGSPTHWHSVATAAQCPLSGAHPSVQRIMQFDHVVDGMAARRLRAR
jgi:hypothetical protein